MSEQHAGEATRRDFLYIATGAAGAVAVAGIVWPLVAQLGPNKREQAAGAPVEIDISTIEPGVQMTVIWRGKPYFIRHLTEAEVTAAKDAPQTQFIDYEAVDTRLAAAEGASAEWTIIGANCTHLGCVPSKVDVGVQGWICPCHGSIFDVTGRVMKGPAPINLPVPPFVFASEEKIIIGQEA